MKLTRTFAISIAFFGLSGCMTQQAVTPTPTLDCPVTNPSALNVSLPSTGNGMPTVDHPRACYDKHNQGVKFELPAQGIGNVYVIFKDETPLVDSNGDKLYVIKGPSAMPPNKTFAIGPKTSVPNADYAYMLVDVKKTDRKVNDPVIVIKR